MRIDKTCEQEAGMLMVAGPTGSGKTTTLHNCIRTIDRDARNVITIEDPVEYHLEGTTQIPVTEDQNFGQLLRSVLRQDPDVILVGEIRDDETSRTAMQAAMTGHLVFSTIHAKDAIGAVFRLLDLGVEPYLVANSIEVILAQRLIRLLCDSCKRPVRVAPGQATRMGRFLEGRDEVYVPVGCTRCLRTGFSGRRAVFEMIEFNDDLRDCVLGKPTIQAMKTIIERGVFHTLQESGWLMAAQGVTALEEIERIS
jgi:general secretion pathway protein E